MRRKKGHEQRLEQTQSQILTLEQQVNAIESANINRETLAAMERAGKAMKSIHQNLTPEKVDETMCVLYLECIIAVSISLLTHILPQGLSSRTKSAQRGDRSSNLISPGRGNHRRRRAGSTARRSATRAARQSDAQVRESTGSPGTASKCSKWGE